MNTNRSYVRAERVALHSEIKEISKRMAEVKASAYKGNESAQLEWSRLWHKRDSSYMRLRELDSWLQRRKGEK